jgi:hypothetical protein
MNGVFYMLFIVPYVQEIKCGIGFSIQKALQMSVGCFYAPYKSLIVGFGSFRSV